MFGYSSSRTREWHSLEFCRFKSLAGLCGDTFEVGIVTRLKPIRDRFTIITAENIPIPIGIGLMIGPVRARTAGLYKQLGGDLGISRRLAN